MPGHSGVGLEARYQYCIFSSALWAVELSLAFILPKLNEIPAMKKRPRVFPRKFSVLRRRISGFCVFIGQKDILKQ